MRNLRQLASVTGVCIFSFHFASLAGEGVAESATGQLELMYTADWLSNRRGGLREASAYLENFDAVLTLAPGWGSRLSSDQLVVHLSHNDGETFSDDIVGDAQVVSNIEAERATRIFQAYYQRSSEEQWRWLFGLWDLNSEIDVVEPAGLFLNSSHGIGPDFSQSGVHGPSIFPVTSLSLYGEYQMSKTVRVRGAMLDAVPATRDRSDLNRVRLDKNEGALLVGELELTLPSDWVSKFGSWYYTEDFAMLDNPEREDKAFGGYLSLAGPLLSPDSERPVNGFLRLGAASESVHEIGHYLGAGLTVQGLFGLRPEDEFGIATAIAYATDEARALGNAAQEANFEITYSAQVTDFLRLQPMVQYIENPGFSAAAGNALVVGVRLEIGHVLRVN